MWAFAFTCYLLISGLGIAVGFHRYFSHRSFSTTQRWEHIMLYCGALACHGNPLFWAALHRKNHHAQTDTEKDVHSPIHGVWQSYQGYAFRKDLPSLVNARAAADFLRKPHWMMYVSHYHKIVYATWVAVLAVGYALDALWLPGGLAIAQVYAIHQEAAVNLLGHTSGWGSYRRHNTGERSVNRNWLGMITWGQSLHNNHHRHPHTASFATPKDQQPHTGIRKLEWDPSMLWIRLIGHDIKTLAPEDINEVHP
jgi:stearoyl-CoA desaturase (delta-9 desaturase)